MLGLSWSEILIIGVVALVLIGPNDLPRAMKTAARWMAAGRKLAREFQGHVDELVREAELDELRESARKIAMQPLSSHLETMIDPDHEVSRALASTDNMREGIRNSPAPAVPGVPLSAEPAESAKERDLIEPAQSPPPIP